MFRQLRGKIGTNWCTMTHNSVLWPVHGQYECRTCGRRFAAFAQPQHRPRSLGPLRETSRPATPSLSRA